jgi:1-aminocyclopropane-1-carboxylate deaminase/D-cysteine desulfhydrase-like pyridoxal-dependent ACC family enzyme
MRHLCRLMVAASLPSYCSGNIAEFVYSRLLGTTCGIIADLVYSRLLGTTCGIIADLVYSGILATPTLLWYHTA